MKAPETVEDVSKAPAPEAIPWALDPSTVTIKVRWWSDPRQASVIDVRGQVIVALENALTRAGVDLPIPTRTLLVHDRTEDADGDRRRQREGGRRRSSRDPSATAGDPGKACLVTPAARAPIPRL